MFRHSLLVQQNHICYRCGWSQPLWWLWLLGLGCIGPLMSWDWPLAEIWEGFWCQSWTCLISVLDRQEPCSPDWVGKQGAAFSRRLLEWSWGPGSLCWEQTRSFRKGLEKAKLAATLESWGVEILKKNVYEEMRRIFMHTKFKFSSALSIKILSEILWNISLRQSSYYIYYTLEWDTAVVALPSCTFQGLYKSSWMYHFSQWNCLYNVLNFHSIRMFSYR